MKKHFEQALGPNVCAVLLAAFSLMLAVSRHDTGRFFITEYSFRSRKVKKPLSICLLSDIHDQLYGEDNCELLEAVRKRRPDLILIAGDLITSYEKQHELKLEQAVRLVGALAGIAPVYVGDGNHEHRLRTYRYIYGDLYEKYTDDLKAAGAVLLRNGSTALPETGLRIYGLDAGEEYFRKFVRTPMPPEYLMSELGEPDPELFNLLIAHHPWYFPEYAGWGADLTVSGHVHGGIIRLPFIGGIVSPAFRLFPWYDGGYYRQGTSRMVVSRGLGTHTIKFRLFNPGDLVMININK